MMNQKYLTLIVFSIGMLLSGSANAGQQAAECRLRIRMKPLKGKTEKHSVAIPLQNEDECDAFARMHRKYFDRGVYKNKTVKTSWAGERAPRRRTHPRRKKASVSATPGYPISNQ